MKVLHLTSDYLPNPLWGMGWHVKFLVEELRKRGCNVYIGTANKSKKEDKKIITTNKKTDEKYLSKNPHEIFNSFSKFNLWQEVLAKKILESNIDFDIVHCHNWMSWITAEKLKEKNPKLKLISTFHLLQKQYDTMAENPTPKYHDNIISIENRMLKNSDKIILLSKRQEGLLKKEYDGFRPSKKSIIPLGTINHSKKIQDLLKIKEKQRNIEISFVGRIEKDKGIIELLKAFKDLSNKYKNIRLNVLGEGTLLNELKREYREKNIIFHGFVNRKDLHKILEKTSIFCLPSYSESGATSVIEAMSFGAIPVFSKGESVPDLYEDKTEGMKIPLVSKNGKYLPKIEDIYNAIEELIENKKTREKISKKTYKVAKQFYSIRIVAKKTIDIYKEVMKKC